MARPLDMRKIFLVFIVMIPFNYVNANDMDAFKALQSHLGNSIKIISKKEIVYCPDQKCKVFRASNRSSDLAAFVYLYLYYAKEYISVHEYLKKERTFRKKAIEEPIIRQANQHYCASVNKTPECILDSMKRKLAVSFCSGNYDEGKFCISCEGKTECKDL